MTDQEVAMDAINRSLAELKRIPIVWFGSIPGSYPAFERAVRTIQSLKEIAQREEG